MTTQVKQKCEYENCKQKATQADTYINAWLCDKHYSKIGTLTKDYQADNIDWDYIENLVIPKILKKGVTQ